MKHLKLFSALLLTAFLSIGQVWAGSKVEGFEKATAGSDYQSTVTVDSEESDCGIEWEFYYGTPSTSSAIQGTNSAALRLYTTDNYGYLKTTTAVKNLTQVEFLAKAATANNSLVKLDVHYSTDGTNWAFMKQTSATGANYEATSVGKSEAKYIAYVPSGVTGDIYVKFSINSSSTKPSKKNTQLTIDSIALVYAEAAEPTVSLTPAVIDFGDVYVGETIEAQEITVAGSNLTGEDALTFTRKAGEESKFSVSLKDGDSLVPSSKAVNAKLLVTPNTETAGAISDSIRINGGGLGADTARVFVKANVKERVWTPDGENHDFGTILQYGDKPEPYKFTLKGTHLTPESEILIRNTSGTTLYDFSPDYVTVDENGEINQEITISLKYTDYPSTMMNNVNIYSNGYVDPVSVTLFTVTTAVTVRYEVTATTDEHGNTFEWSDGTNDNPQYGTPGTTSITPTPKPAAGYAFVANSWNIYRTNDSDDKVEHTSGVFTMPNHDVTISGEFEATSDPEIAVSKTALDFGEVDINSEPEGLTFTITGANLTQNISLLTGNENEAFTLSKPSLTKEEVMAKGGVEITVTPKPTYAGTITNKIYAIWDGGEQKIVDLSMTVNKLAANISWPYDASNAIIGEPKEFQVLNNPRKLPVVYSSSNTEVATISNEEGHEGEVTLVGPGYAFIYANFAGNDTVAAVAENSVYYTLNVQKKYTATWYVNGVSKKTQIALEGADLEEAPEAVASGDCEGLVFMGWAEAPLAEAQDEAPTYTTKTQMPAADVNFYAVFATKSVGKDVKKTDNIDLTFTGVSGTSYTAWSESKTGTSGAVYIGVNAGGNEAVQFRSDVSETKPASGIISTASAGKVSKVTITWNSNTANGRKLDVFGSNTAYTAVADLVNDKKKGALIGSIVNGTSTTLTIPDSAFIGLRSNSGAMYLDNIAIEWTIPGATTYSGYLTTCPHCETVSFVKEGEDNGNTFALKVGGEAVTAVKTCEAASVDVVATPATGYELTNFEVSGIDDVTYSEGVISIPAGKTGTLTATATFTKINYTVTMAQTGDAGATLTGATDAAHYGDEITVTASAVNGFAFVKWSATPSVEFADAYAATTTFTMPNSDVTVTAQYAKLYTVAEAIAKYDASGNTNNIVVEGYICSIYSSSVTSGGQISYYIKDVDENGFLTGTQFEAYNGKGLNGASFTKLDDIEIGAKVRIFGNLKKFNSTYELDANNYQLSYDAGTFAGVVIYGEASKTEYFYNEDFSFNGLNAKETWDNGYAQAITFANVEWAAVPAKITATGNVSVTATYDEHTSAAKVIAVTKQLRTLTDDEFGWSDATGKAYTVGKAAELPELNNTHELTGITYTSTAEAKATIDANGDVHPVAAGATTIKAAFAGNDEYAAKEVSYELTVCAPVQIILGGELTKDTYESGDPFDRDGLTATLKYDDDETYDFTNGAEWLIDGHASATVYETSQFSVQAGYEDLADSETFWAYVKTHAVTFADPANGTLVIKNGETPISSGDEFSKNTILTVEATPANGYVLSTLTAGSADIKESKSFTIGTEDVEVSATFARPYVAIMGQFNEWSGEANPLAVALDEKTASAAITLTLNENYGYGFKVLCGDNTLSIENGSEWYHLKRTWNSAPVKYISNTSNPIWIEMDMSGDYTFTWDYTDSTLTITYPALPEWEYYVAGSFTNWGTNKVKMTTTDEETWTATFELEANKTGENKYEFKIVEKQLGETWLGLQSAASMVYGNCTDWVIGAEDGDNYKAAIGLETTKKANYTFTYVPATKKVSVDIPNPSPATGVDNTADETKAVKFLENGQIFILRGEKVYTVDGQLVK